MNLGTKVIRTLATTWLLTATIWLSGCGFHLRGDVPQISSSVSPMYVTGLEKYSEFRRDLRDAVQMANAATVDDRAAASSVLKIHDYISDRRVLSVDSRNKTVEYELEESLAFSLLSTDGSERVAEQRIRTLRILLNPGIDTLSRNREEELLREDMRKELAERLIRRISAQQ